MGIQFPHASSHTFTTMHCGCDIPHHPSGRGARSPVASIVLGGEIHRIRETQPLARHREETSTSFLRTQKCRSESDYSDPSRLRGQPCCFKNQHQRNRATPTGRYSAGYKDPDHYSSLYHSAPMPWSVQVSGNIFIHGSSSVPNYPASHGCIRVPLTGRNAAKRFFQWVDPGTPIRIAY